MSLLVIAEPAVDAEPDHDDCEDGGHEDEEDAADQETSFGAAVAEGLVFEVGFSVGMGVSVGWLLCGGGSEGGNVRTSVVGLDDTVWMMRRLFGRGLPALWRNARRGGLVGRSVPRSRGLGWPFFFVDLYVSSTGLDTNDVGSPM